MSDSNGKRLMVGLCVASLVATLPLKLSLWLTTDAGPTAADSIRFALLGLIYIGLVRGWPSARRCMLVFCTGAALSGPVLLIGLAGGHLTQAALPLLLFGLTHIVCLIVLLRSKPGHEHFRSHQAA